MGQKQKHEPNLTTTAPGGARAPYLSKSKFLSGLQCHKLLWHAYNAKDKIPPPDAQTQAIFDQGHEVGSPAKKLFPKGIEVGQGVTVRPVQGDTPAGVLRNSDRAALR